MNKKQKTTVKLTAGGIALVVLSAALTVGGIRLFSHEKGDKVLEKLLHIEFNDDFFKNCKETTVQNDDEGGVMQVLTYTIPKTDYEIQISNDNTGEFDFKKSLNFNVNQACTATITISNIDAIIIEFSGENTKKEIVEENRSMIVEETKLADGTQKYKSTYSASPKNSLVEIVKLQSFTIYGNE